MEPWQIVFIMPVIVMAAFSIYWSCSSQREQWIKSLTCEHPGTSGIYAASIAWIFLISPIIFVIFCLI